MISPFPRLVARFTRPSISYFSRTQDTHLSCKHLSPPFPLPDVRFPIHRHSSPYAYSFSRRCLTRGERASLAEWSFLPHTCVPHPPDTCSVAVEHDEPTENPMVTLTDHVGARIFSSSCRSSRIHNRDSDTLGRGVNNDLLELDTFAGDTQIQQTCTILISNKHLQTRHV